MNTIADYEKAALEKLGPGLADYIQKTAGTGNTFRANLSAYAGYEIRGRNWTTKEPSTRRTILGNKLSAPIMIAPTAWHGMFTPRGEHDTLRAAKDFGTNFAISSFSTLDFHEMGTELSCAWYQILMYTDLGLMKRYIDKAVDAGCSAIVLTIDAVAGCSMCKADPAVPAVEFPLHRLPLFPEDPAVPYMSFDDYYRKYMPMKLNWEDVSEIVRYSSVPVVLKGAMVPDDVLRAIQVGAKAVIISNHGGRQNDALGSTLDVVARLPAGLRQQIDVYLDGGIRSGADVFKALALGAKAVLIGRPALYGLAVMGDYGLVDVLNILTHELREWMREAGCDFVEDITADKIRKL